MRILIAEDDLTSRNVLTIFLKKLGHELVVTMDGAEAWQAMQLPEAPKLAILDWMMPEIEGIEVCRRIRTLKTTQPVYVIMLTAKADKEDVITGLNAGADDYLTKPFDFNELRARVEVGMRMIEMHANLMEARHKIDDALQAAGKIQQSLLPTILPEVSQVDFAWKFVPCDAVGGDIFNVVSIDSNHVGMYMLDVAGHGPPSAMISVLVYQLMNAHTGILVDRTVNPPRIREPEEVLNLLDQEFPLMRFKRHFTLVYAVLNLASGELTYSNAAHCSPIVLSSSHALKVLTTSGTVIGVGAMPFGQETVMLAHNDKVMFLSDGVEEMRNPADELFGEERLHQTLHTLRTASPTALVQGLYDEVLLFAEAQPAADDVSILAFEFIG